MKGSLLKVLYMHRHIYIDLVTSSNYKAWRIKVLSSHLNCL